MMPAVGNSGAGRFLWLACLFLLALLPRLYSAQTVGWDWDGPGSFTLINFDEGGSCRAELQGFPYSTFIGGQTVAITEAMGQSVPPGTRGDHRAVKQYCHSPLHILVARSYSAVTGALTVVLLAVMGLMLVPDRPQVAWTAAALLALSGFHVSESHAGTVDAPSVFYIYAFLTLMIYAVTRRRPAALLISPLLLIPAVWTKYWVFAGIAYLAVLPRGIWEYLSTGLSPHRIFALLLGAVILFVLVTNADFQAAGYYPLLALYYLLVPWKKVNKGTALLLLAMPLVAYGMSTIGIIADYTTSGLEGRFGTGYAAIGWNKWLRNPLNVVTVLVVGLGLPACFFLPAGLRAMFADKSNRRAWLCLAPVGLFLAFMMFISPVTYYRHYLALLPAAALIAALGLWVGPWAKRRWFLVLFFAWPVLLMFDMEADFHRDPRLQLRPWYSAHAGEPVYITYYVSPPPGGMRHSRLFKPEYAFDGAEKLRQANFLILSESWYDTAFPSELNGPWTGHPERLIKTRPEYAHFYREALSGRHPNLRLEAAFDVDNLMPELILHKWLYGNFHLLISDLKVFRIVD